MNVPAITTAQMREVDRLMIEVYGIELIQMMENAGRNLAVLARQRFLDGDPAGKRVLALVGSGGNGGGGLVALGDETLYFRMKSSRVKADQVKETGATILATACENCHTQLDNLNDHYKMGVEVRYLSSMIADALS